MPDLRAFLNGFAPNRALVNARREVAEQARIHAEVDALANRLAVIPPRQLLVTERRAS